MKKRRVNWKPGVDVGADKTLAPYFPIDVRHYGISDPTSNEKFIGVKPGSLFRIVKPLEVLPAYPQRESPPHPYLTRFDTRYPRFSKVAGPGDIAVYMGEIRVPEGQDADHVRRVLRHKFLIGGCIYVIHELDCVEPVGLE